ncbi:2Fe-2S iron-sulfur cluster-binding protein [Salisaeta longa]|uniref:2Fe-2S iron-sulfur cluster-binding protein n=1 Tax=Salisaeta longa TaxID=503170 RepID=UPI0003B41597|nr:2Fe-2S iron-sulfur cluster-binding protein [Salisaeta longa]
MKPTTHTVRVHDGARWHTLAVPHGTPLRTALLRAGLSPYTALTQRFNCGGRGLCATCGVRVDPPAPAPTHWHDRLAQRFGYPRLSCQMAVNRPLTVHLLPDKYIWRERS